MRTVSLTMLLFGLLFFSSAPAQETKQADEAKSIRMVLVDVDELNVEEPTKLVVADVYRLHVFEGARPGEHYLVVKLRRVIPAGAATKLEDVNVTLTFGSQAPVKPYAVTLEQKELKDDTTEYLVDEKRRTSYENYYFPVGKGQYEWTVRVNGEPEGNLAEFFVKLLIANTQAAQARLTLPSGAKEVIRENRRETFQFPSGKEDLVLEVRGQTRKFKMPWKRYKKGEMKFIQMVDELREAPTLPVDTIKGALPKIAVAWKMHHKTKGTGGGSYNIATRGDPVNVRIEFGRGGERGGIYLIEADGIVVEFDDDGKYTRFSQRNKRWEIIPWGKETTVDIAKDATKVTGEIRSGVFVVRATRRRQAQFDADGMLKKGIIFDSASSAYYEVDRIESMDKLVILYGTETSEPK